MMNKLKTNIIRIQCNFIKNYLTGAQHVNTMNIITLFLQTII